jgi:hypothetical protein
MYRHILTYIQPQLEHSNSRHQDAQYFRHPNITSVTELCYPVAVTVSEQKHSQTWTHLKGNVALILGRIKVFSVN